MQDFWDPPSAPPERFALPRLSHPAAIRLALAALAAGAFFDVGVRGGPANMFVATGIGIVGVNLLIDHRVERVEARWCAVSAVPFAVVLALRASPWVVTSNGIAACALLGAAVLYARSGSLADTTTSAIGRRALAAASRAGDGLALLASLIPERRGISTRGARIARGGLVALPALIIVVALLASADAVFARFVVPQLDAGPAIGHAVLVMLFAFGILAGAAAALGDANGGARPGTFGVVEIVTMLALTAGVLGMFVASQLVALTGAGRRLVDDAGLTPAQYARSGFFQLCWATAILVGLLALVRGLAAPGVFTRPVVRILAAIVPVFALGLVAVSVRRMALYDEAFGLTMLRLWVVGAAMWLGGVLVMMALRNAGVGGGRGWVIAGAGAWALVLVLVGSAVNVEAFVVRHNVARAETGAELDVWYLRTLSDDAVPAIVDAFSSAGPLSPSKRRFVLRCDDRPGGVARWNLAVERAERLRRDHCRK